MKKKILLFVAIMAMLVCVFAVSVSADSLVASDSNEYGTLSTIDNVPEPSVIDKDAKAVVVVDGKYYTIPSYYLIKDNATFDWSVNSNVASTLGLPSNQNVRNYLARMEVPKNVTTIGDFKFEQTKTLVEVTLPSTLTELGIGTFKACTSLVEVKNLENTQITALRVDEGTVNNRSRGVFINCTSLKTLSIPKTVTKIYPWSIVGCTALESFIIPEDSQLTFIGRYAFEDAKALKEIRLPNSLETIEFGAFNRANALTKIENFANTKVTKIDYDTFSGAPLVELQLPSGLVEVGKNAFKGHKIVQNELVIPNGVTTIGGWAFAGAYENNVCKSNIGKIVLSANLTTFADNYVFENVLFGEMYIPATLTKVTQGVFNRLSSKGVVFYIAGTEEQATSLKAGAGSSNGSFTGATVADLVTYTSATDKANKNYIVFGITPCDAFYNGEHTLDPDKSNACAGVCGNCGEISQAANPVHVFTTTISYADGFTAVGVKCELCSNENCQYSVTAKETEAPAILSGYKGFSVPENTKIKGITFGYDINKTALSEYEEYNAKLEMGFVVAINAQLNGSKPFDDGVTASVIDAKFTDGQSAYNRVDFVLKGDIWDTMVDMDKDGVDETLVSDIEFFMCAYVIAGDNVSYIIDPEDNGVTSYAAQLAKE